MSIFVSEFSDMRILLVVHQQKADRVKMFNAFKALYSVYCKHCVVVGRLRNNNYW